MTSMRTGFAILFSCPSSKPHALVRAASRVVNLMIPDSLLLQMLPKARLGSRRKRHSQVLPGIIQVVPGRRSCRNLSRNSVTMVQPAESREGLCPGSLCRGSRPDALPGCPSPVPNALGPHGSS